MRNLYRILLCVLVAFPFRLNAQQVSVSDALLRAKNFMISEADNSTGSTALARRRTASNSTYSLAYTSTVKNGNTPSFYVVNTSAGGYVIVSADERTDKQILGYSNANLFEFEKVPDNLKSILDIYDEEISYLVDNVEPRKAGEKASEHGNHIVVDQLMTTKWDQDGVYNLLCPVDPTDGKRCYTGCVATAMAQIMFYHKYPERPTGSNSYTSRTRGLPLSENFCESCYDWENMLTSYSESLANAGLSNDKNMAVAKLMFDVGVAMNMDYSSSGSGAYTEDAADVLKKYFKYDNLKCDYLSNVGFETWRKHIEQELDNHRPVLYANNRHCFVCDGYTDDGFYSFNLGWGGDWDGWYTLSTSTNKKPGQYVNTATSARNAKLVYGIEPPQK